MNVLHLIGGGDVGGAKVHVLSLVKELGKHIDVKLISLRPGAFTDEARSMGIDIEVVKTHNFIRDIRKLLNIIKEGNYQIIHSHGAKANMVSAIIKKCSNLPTVTTIHSDYRLDYLRSKYKMFTYGVINTIALRFIDNYIAVSNNFREMLIGRGFRAERIYTIYNGINFDVNIPTFTRKQFSEKYSINLKEDDIVIGILSRLDPVKRLDIFLQAAAVVLKHKPGIKFLIGGEGSHLNHLERKVAALGISNNVYFVGWVNKYEFFNCIDINVLTSISESFSYSILEGTQFKKATVCSRVGGFPDLIDSGINGYLFEPGDHKKLAAYILELAANATKRQEMGEKIFEEASLKFSLDNMCKTQIDIYNNILNPFNSAVKVRKGHDVILSGYYGFKNIGDDAMLQAIINNLRMYKNDIRIMVLSKKPLETKEIYNVDSINRINIFRIFRTMKYTKLFIYGGGNLIQDNTSTRSLVYYLSTIWLAKRLGLKVMFYANGFGPLKKSNNKRLTKKIMNQVDVITLREKLSMDELNNMCIDKPKIIITADPALTVDYIEGEEIDEIFANENINTQGPFVGISVRKWQGFEKYEEVIARTADYMIEKYDIKPVFIPMHYPNDLYTIESVISKMKGKGYVIKNKYSVPQTLGIIKRMEMLVGMRLHALIFATSMNIPVVGLVYEPKIEGFLQYANQSSAGDVMNLKYDNLKNIVDEVWNNRRNIEIQLKKDIVLLKERALKNAEIAVELINPDYGIKYKSECKKSGENI